MGNNSVLPATGDIVEDLDTFAVSGEHSKRQVVTLSPRDLSTGDSIGGLTEVAPATDIASSGLNGRLQRIAQRISSLIGILPAALGTGGGLKVDGSGQALPVIGSGIFVAAGATLTRPADAAPYSVGDIVAQSATAISCSGVAVAAARANDLTGMMRRCRIKVNSVAWLNAQLYVHVFKDAPTFAQGDNAAFSASLTESNYIGAFDVTLDRQFSDPLVKGIGIPRSGSEMNFEPSAGTPNVYFVIETRTAVTPVAGSVFTVVFEVLQN